jgi:UTP--glucose-1-phosphate uridylyltransferase
MWVQKAIFPVAGLGTRFLPATKAQPKEMLPVVDKPLIQYAVEEAYAAGVREMIFVTGRHKRPIEDHFDMTFELEVALENAGKRELLEVVRSVKPDDMECIYVRQAQALGLGHAVLCGQRLVGKEPFAVLLADDLMVGEPPVLKQMVEQFGEWRASILAVQEVPVEHTRRYGIVAGTPVNDRLIDISRIVEKPAPEDAPSRLGVAGRYILTPGVFHEIATQPRGVGGEIQLTDGIASLLRREKVFAYRYQGKRYDCGSKEGFLQANVELALAHPEVGPGFREYLKGLALRGGTRGAGRRHAPAEGPNAISRVTAEAPGGWPGRRLAPPEHVDEVRAGGLLLDQFVAGLAGERLEVAHRAGVGRDHAQHVAAGEVGQRLLGLQDRQRAVQSAGVEFGRGGHGR